MFFFYLLEFFWIVSMRDWRPSLLLPLFVAFVVSLPLPLSLFTCQLLMKRNLYEKHLLILSLGLFRYTITLLFQLKQIVRSLWNEFRFEIIHSPFLYAFFLSNLLVFLSLFWKNRFLTIKLWCQKFVCVYIWTGKLRFSLNYNVQACCIFVKGMILNRAVANAYSTKSGISMNIIQCCMNRGWLCGLRVLLFAVRSR